MIGSGVAQKQSEMHFGHLSMFPELAHGIFTRPAMDEASLESILPGCMVQMEQVHGSEIVVVEACEPHLVQTADGLVTRVSGIQLAVRTADCVPLLFYDPVARLAAMAHAGWRGTATHITEKVIAKLQAMGSNPSHLRVGLGPAICGRDYEVGPEVWGQMKRPVGPDQRHLDLQAMQVEQCVAAGCMKANIELMPVCTLEHPQWFPSWRRGDRSERFFSYIGLAPTI